MPLRAKGKLFTGPLGLRWGRLREWLRAVRAVDRRITAREWFAMFWLTVSADFGPPVPVVANYRICVRCPFHDRTLHQCLICGCYLPFKLAAGGKCAAKEIDPDSPIGF